MIKNYKYIIAILILVIIIIAFGAYKRSSDAKLYRLEGLYEGNKKEAEKEKQEAQKIIQELKKEIKERDGLIALSEGKVIDLKKGDEVKSQDLERLESEIVNLQDKDKIIENLKSQVDIWKQRFNLAQEMQVEKDKIIFNLKEKYDAQLKISTQWEAQFNKQVALNKIAEERIALADKKISRLSFESKIEKVLITGLVIYVGVKIIG